jgi:hypothetical protein
LKGEKTMKKKPNRQAVELLAESLGEELPNFDGLEAAVIGYADPVGGGGPRLVYSAPGCVRIYIRQGMTPGEALEFAEFNLLGQYIGERTPIFVWPFPEDIIQAAHKKPKGGTNGRP